MNFTDCNKTDKQNNRVTASDDNKKRLDGLHEPKNFSAEFNDYLRSRRRMPYS